MLVWIEKGAKLDPRCVPGRGGLRYLLTVKYGSSGPGLRTWKVASVAFLFAWVSARCASVNF